MKAIVQISGGFGNQLLQLYFAKKINNVSKYTNVDLDTLFFSNQHNPLIDKREYHLKYINGNLNEVVNEFTSWYWNSVGKKNFLSFFWKYFFNGNFYVPINGSNHNIFKLFVKLFFNNHYYTGIWQEDINNEELRVFLHSVLEDNEDIIYSKHVLYFKKIILQKKYSIALCIRRGDYEKLGLAKPFEEYKENMDQIAAQLDEQPNFFIFSDDINACRKAFENSPYEINFVDQSTHPIENFYLISICSKAIISRSSYELLAVNASRKMTRNDIYVDTNWQLSNILEGK